MIRCTTLLLATLIAPQDSLEPAQQGDYPTASEIMMQAYRPEFANATDLYSVAHELIQTPMRIRNAQGGLSQRPNLQLLHDTLLLYDLPDSLQRNLALLKQLDRAAQPTKTESVVHDYRPRFLTGDSVVESLQPFQLSRRGQRNVTYVRERGVVVLQAEQEKIDEILSFLGRIDVPKPQVLVTGYLITGTNGPSDSQLPAELVKGMSELTGIAGFEMEAMAMVRSAVDLGRPLSVLFRARTGGSYELSMIPAAYDAASRSLTLAECKLLAGQNSGYHDGAVLFQTSTSVTGGEYTVLGATGADPYFVVLHSAPLSK